MVLKTRGFITILTGIYSLQDCIHFVASVRKFHQEPIIILINGAPKILYPVFKAFGNVTLKEAPSHKNPVLASRQAKLRLYKESPFEQTIYMDCDICLLSNINEVFEYLDEVDLLVTEDVQPSIAKATNLIRVKQPEVLPILQAVGLPLKEDSIQYNGGFMAFKKSDKNEKLFWQFKKYFDVVTNHQDVLLLKDQGAFASAIEAVKPSMKVLPPTYNYLNKWKECYKVAEPIKVLHCTYPYRPQYAKDITRSIYTRFFDRFAKIFLPDQVNNPWRTR